MKLIADGRFKTILHIFSQVGHTILLSHRDFGVVEKYVRNYCQYVFSPKEWEEVLVRCQKKRPMIVHRMTIDDFVKVSNLRENFNQNLSTFSDDKFEIRNAVRLQFSSQDPGIMHVSDKYYGEMEPISLRRRGRPVKFLEGVNCNLPILRQSPRPIEATKLNDVLYCLQYIPEVHHDYYKALKVVEKSKTNNESSEYEL